MTDATAWQETAMPVGVEATPTVRVGREDLEAAVHGGVITGAQAKALWLRWSNPGQAARATGPGSGQCPKRPKSHRAAAGWGADHRGAGDRGPQRRPGCCAGCCTSGALGPAALHLATAFTQQKPTGSVFAALDQYVHVPS